MGRNVVVFSMADNTRNSINTSVSTWGEILSQSPDIRNMVIPDMKILIKETKAEIASSETVIPQHDVTIFLTPGKVKSGNNQQEFDALADALAMELLEDGIAALEADCLAAEARGYTRPAVVADDMPF